MLRRGAVLLAILAGGCAPVLTPQGHGVSVYLVKAGGVPRDSQMPEGCRLLGTKAPVNMSEAELAQEDPYRLARNDAGAAGGNALLVRSKMIASRRNVNCPVASPITDCPGNSGAWFSIVFESYSCTSEALKTLNTPKPSPSPSAKPSS